MLNVLIDAYAIAPNWGSEQGMGWNWISNLAKFCNLYIITEGEWQREIEQSLYAAMSNNMDKSVNPTGLTRQQAEHMHFFYLPVSAEIREMCWNQGTWKFYMYYEQWERRALEKAKEIISTYSKVPGGQIDIVHKLNMICYREPSYLWKIKDIPFVWGPVGAYGMYPKAFLEDAPMSFRFKMYIKDTINYLSFRYNSRVRKAMKRADAVIGAYKETHAAIREIYHPEAILINETGAVVNENAKPHASDSEEFKLIWVGKYDHRKQLGVAIQTMNLLKHKKNIHLYVLGGGYDADVTRYKDMVAKLELENNVHLVGKVPNVKAKEMMASADLFFFTSIDDATSTVVPEAISAGLPIVCHDTRGFGVIVDDKIGLKVGVKNPEYSVREFAKIIDDLEAHRDVVRKLSTGCIERQNQISWEANAKKMVEQYELAIERFESKQ